MDPHRQRRITSVLQSALELPPEDREAYLDQACGDDRSLRDELRERLADGEAAGPAGVHTDLETTWLDSPRAAGSSTETGARLGPYRLVREIGQGGMGTVYLATRDDGAYHRQVAIKWLNPGMQSAGLVQRFEAERQILASLDHPSIARLFDGGATADGRPYLVMEYIEGRPIDDYCDRHRLSVRQRLELFRQVCSAVHYAHQNLVVHRDIKPSNILVTAEGVPRLLDFGIAKLLTPETGEAAPTVIGLQPMTPQYASPEQIRGETITTVSDVYSLGVLLYRLLTDRFPYDVQGLPPSEMDRLLSDSDPAPPSAALSSSRLRQRVLEAVSDRRAVRPPALLRQLTGDLDNIVLMALRAEPAQRYLSAAQLAEDLRRHLVGLPVVARPNTTGYRLGKFLRRNRLAVAVAGLFILLLSTFATTSAYQATQTARQRDRAEVERAKAEKVSRFLVDLFREVDPLRARGGSIATGEALAWGAERINRELEDEPDVRSALLDAIGTVYMHLGQYDEAAPLLEHALAIRRAQAGRSPDSSRLDIAESLDHVGALQLQKGLYASAEPLLQDAFEIREQELPPDHPDLATSLRNLSILRRGQGRYDQAESLGHRALAIFERALGPEHPEVALCLRAVAGIHARRGQFKRAEPLIERALAIDENSFGEMHSATATNLHNLGVLRIESGQHVEAEELFRRSLAIWEALLDEGHPRIAEGLVSLGRSLKYQVQYDRAEVPFRRALQLHQAAHGDHPKTANCLFELGDLLRLQGDPSAAEPLLKRSLEIREQDLGVDNPMTAESVLGMADLRRFQGRFAEAEQLYERALEVWKRYPGHEALGELPESYARLLRELGRSQEATDLEKQTRAILAEHSAQ